MALSTTPAFRYPYDIQTTLEPWRDELGPDYDNVVAILRDRDRSIEDYVSRVVVDQVNNTLNIVLSGGTVATIGPLTAWTTWAPVLTQGGTVAATVTYARYMRIGRTVHVTIRLDVTGAGAANTEVNVTFPFLENSVSNEIVYGAGFVYDASANQLYPALVVNLNSLSIKFRPTNVTGNVTLGSAGAPFAAALAAGDIISCSYTYETAAN